MGLFLCWKYDVSEIWTLGHMENVPMHISTVRVWEFFNFDFEKAHMFENIQISTIDCCIRVHIYIYIHCNTYQPFASVSQLSQVVCSWKKKHAPGCRMPAVSFLYVSVRVYVFVLEI